MNYRCLCSVNNPGPWVTLFVGHNWLPAAHLGGNQQGDTHQTALYNKVSDSQVFRKAPPTVRLSYLHARLSLTCCALSPHCSWETTVCILTVLDFTCADIGFLLRTLSSCGRDGRLTLQAHPVQEKNAPLWVFSSNAHSEKHQSYQETQRFC